MLNLFFESPSGTKIKKGLALQGLFFRLQKSYLARVGAAEGCDLLILPFHSTQNGGTFHKDSPHGIAAGNRCPLLTQIGL